MQAGHERRTCQAYAGKYMMHRERVAVISFPWNENKDTDKLSELLCGQSLNEAKAFVSLFSPVSVNNHVETIHSFHYVHWQKIN